MAEERAEQPTTREVLEELRAAGAVAFAPEAVAFVEALLARGAAIGGAAGERLLARASARAGELARELERAKERVDVRAAKRREIAPAPRALADAGWTGRLLAEARRRGIALGGRARTAHVLSVALYEASRAELGAMVAGVHAEAEIPEDAGPYNPLAIAARTLGELATMAPGYLAALIGQLEELAPMLALPLPPPDAASAAPAARRRRARSKPPGAGG